MLTGINLKATRKYVSKTDLDKENPTVFQIGVLDSFTKSWIEDKMTQFELGADGPDGQAKGVSLAINKRNMLIVKHGVKDIENYMDPETGTTVKVSLESTNIGPKHSRVLPDKILAMIPLSIIGELAEEVLREQDLTGEAAKN